MKTLTGYLYYPDSLTSENGVLYFLARSEEDNTQYLGILGDASGFEGFREEESGALLCPLTHENAARLRAQFAWLRPQALGLQARFGFGDRIGQATAGHAQAVQKAAARGQMIAPLFAQQSVRENSRTHRTPQDVMDCAMWGVFQTGWHGPWGADADHLKTQQDIDSFKQAGFTFFTIDPGEYVDHSAQQDGLVSLVEKARSLPWDTLHSSFKEQEQLYLGKTVSIEDLVLSFDQTALLRALVKYGRAIAYTSQLAAFLSERAGAEKYDLEVSVDETETPTSPLEHFFIASEIKRLGVQWVSLAPRYTGRFEKGVDYIGNLAEFETEFARHAAIARYFGNYCLSLHSGSDKFSLYAIAARHTRGLLHLKTAGTSYLEALRVTAQVDPVLFRNIIHLAYDRYEIDRASYHVSGQLSRAPDPASLPDHELPSLLDQFDARQACHVTFGAVLDRYGPALCSILRINEDLYSELLVDHFDKHLAPLQISAG